MMNKPCKGIIENQDLHADRHLRTLSQLISLHRDTSRPLTITMIGMMTLSPTVPIDTM